MSQLIAQNAFRIVEGRPVTSSRTVADYFSKKHSDVVRAIQTILAQKPELEASRNFAQWSEEVEIGSGAKRTVICYWMDRKGFSILAMGFTGAKALDFKCAFYDEFERMEKELHKQDTCPIATLTPTQQLQLREAVAKRAKDVSAHYQTVYRALYARFQVPRYTEILAKDFDAAIEFIRTMKLNVPEEIPQAKAAPVPECRPKIVVSPTFCENMRNFIFIWNYLHRDHLIRFLKLLKDLRSPYAEGLSDAIHSLNMDIIELSLADIGFPVKELDCYKYWAIKHAAK